MCFSAGASFATGAALAAAGVISVSRVKEKAEIPFAVIPFLFSFQQLSEGALWYALTHPGHERLQDAGTYTFLFFAQVLWPFWVPFSILLCERKPRHRKILKVVLGIGTLLSLYLLYCLIMFPVVAVTGDHHIHYTLDFPHKVIPLSAGLYFIPIVLSPFISSDRKIWVLGIGNLLAYVTSELFFDRYVVSVWCFFAAVLSILVIWIMWKRDRLTANPE